VVGICKRNAACSRFVRIPRSTGRVCLTMCLIGLTHQVPGEYWSSLDVSQRFERISVPALHISGWYDMFLKGSVDGFLALSSSREAILRAKINT